MWVVGPIDNVPELDEDYWYEACPYCHGEEQFCMKCWGTGLIEHEHQPDIA